MDAPKAPPATIVVFGAMGDKDLGAILRRMASRVDAWHFTDLPIGRALGAEALATLYRGLDLPSPGADPVPIATHASPAEALAAALAEADPADRIVVFGSFSTVGGVLQDGLPRLTGRHVA